LGRRRVPRIEFGIEFAEFRPLGAARERVRFAGEGPLLEARESLQRVLRPADDLAELAVAHDVDSSLCLLPHDRGYRPGEAGRKSRLVHVLPLLPGAEEFDQLRRPDQAADMARQDALGAAFHGCELVANSE
jgi:hypothetical protein